MPSAAAREPATREAPGAAPAPATPAQLPQSPWPAHSDPSRWFGITRDYRPEEVERLRGTVAVEHTLARLGAERLWELLRTRPYVHALGALSGQQAVQMVKAGLEAIYLSGWQVAADANTAGQTYPDQSLYPADSVPQVVRRINRALQRADQIAHAEGKDGTWWARCCSPPPPSSGPSARRGSPPTSWACPPSSSPAPTPTRRPSSCRTP